jgi:hypothetical protein
MKTIENMSTEKDTTYNGWTNYETWNVALWLDNEQDSSDYWRERAEELAKELKDEPSANARLTGREPFTLQEKIALKLREELKDLHEENAPTVEGVYADLLNAALSEVNWYEIGKKYADEVELPAEETEETE